MFFKGAIVAGAVFFQSAFCLAQMDNKNFLVQPLNSPVKEKLAKFSVQLPKGLSSKALFVRITGSSQQLEYKKIKVLISNGSTKIFEISVTHLAPGKYVLEAMPAPSFFERIVNYFRHSHASGLTAKAEFELDKSLEVADPGEVGLSTLEGVDSDKDGIRDDIQRWIAETYNAHPRIRAAAKQLAQDQQLLITHAADKEASNRYARRFFDTMMCVEWLLGDREEEDIRRRVSAKMQNTRTRIEAQIKTDANFNGEFVEYDSKNPELKCRFDIKSLSH